MEALRSNILIVEVNCILSRQNEDYAKISLRKLENTSSDDQTDWKISYISAKREVIALKKRQQNPSNYKAVSTIHPQITRLSKK